MTTEQQQQQEEQLQQQEEEQQQQQQQQTATTANAQDTAAAGITAVWALTALLGVAKRLGLRHMDCAACCAAQLRSLHNLAFCCCSRSFARVSLSPSQRDSYMRSLRALFGALRRCGNKLLHSQRWLRLALALTSTSTLALTLALLLFSFTHLTAWQIDVARSFSGALSGAFSLCVSLPLCFSLAVSAHVAQCCYCWHLVSFSFFLSSFSCFAVFRFFPLTRTSSSSPRLHLPLTLPCSLLPFPLPFFLSPPSSPLFYSPFSTLYSSLLSLPFLLFPSYSSFLPLALAIFPFPFCISVFFSSSRSSVCVFFCHLPRSSFILSPTYLSLSLSLSPSSCRPQ